MKLDAIQELSAVFIPEPVNILRINVREMLPYWRASDVYTHTIRTKSASSPR